MEKRLKKEIKNKSHQIINNINDKSISLIIQDILKSLPENSNAQSIVLNDSIIENLKVSIKEYFEKKEILIKALKKALESEVKKSKRGFKD